MNDLGLTLTVCLTLTYTARLAQSVEHGTLTSRPEVSQGRGFEPHIGRSVLIFSKCFHLQNHIYINELLCLVKLNVVFRNYDANKFEAECEENKLISFIFGDVLKINAQESGKDAQYVPNFIYH